MKKVYLHGGRVQTGDLLCGFEHIGFCFARQSVNQVQTGAYAGFLQFTVALKKFVIAVASVDDLCRFIVDGLQAKLHSEMGLAVYVAEQGDNIIGKAVGPCAD